MPEARTVFRTVLVLGLLGSIAGCAGIKPNPRYNREREERPAASGKPAKTSQPTGKTFAPTGHVPKAAGAPDNLDSAIESWWGTPYRLGGEKKNVGVDCSAYVQDLYDTVYGKTLPRTTAEQFKLGWPVGLAELRRGDLVFFNTSGGGVSHVGLFMGGGLFTHASSTDGVTINNLDEPYYKKRFMGAKRIN